MKITITTLLFLFLFSYPTFAKGTDSKDIVRASALTAITTNMTLYHFSDSDKKTRMNTSILLGVASTVTWCIAFPEASDKSIIIGLSTALVSAGASEFFNETFFANTDGKYVNFGFRF